MPNELKPLWMGTRRRRIPLNIAAGAAWAANGAWRINVPKVGYLESVDLQLAGTMTIVGASALTPRGGWQIMNRIEVRINGGLPIYSCTGWDAHILDRIHRRSVAPVAEADAAVLSQPVAAAANVWVHTWRIPISANWHREFWLGLINSQASNTEVTIEGRYGANLDAVTALGGGAGYAGNLTAALNYYEPGGPDVAAPPRLLHRCQSSEQVITAAGDQTYELPREGRLYRLVHTIVRNDALDNVWTAARIRAARSDEIYRYQNPWEFRWEQQLQYSRQLPAGVLTYDFFDADGEPATGNVRDTFDAENISTMESIVNLTNAPAGTENRIYHVREFIQAM